MAQIWYFKGECRNCSRTFKSSEVIKQETWSTYLTKLFFQDSEEEFEISPANLNALKAKMTPVVDVLKNDPDYAINERMKAVGENHGVRKCLEELRGHFE